MAAVFFGDGASSEGDFYEAANLAGVLRAPVIFLLVNNHWAISTPVSRQTAAASFADKAVAAGFPGRAGRRARPRRRARGGGRGPGPGRGR